MLHCLKKLLICIKKGLIVPSHKDLLMKKLNFDKFKKKIYATLRTWL